MGLRTDTEATFEVGGEEEVSKSIYTTATICICIHHCDDDDDGGGGGGGGGAGKPDQTGPE